MAHYSSCTLACVHYGTVLLSLKPSLLPGLCTRPHACMHTDALSRIPGAGRESLYQTAPTNLSYCRATPRTHAPGGPSQVCRGNACMFTGRTPARAAPRTSFRFAAGACHARAAAAPNLRRQFRSPHLRHVLAAKMHWHAMARPRNAATTAANQTHAKLTARKVWRDAAKFGCEPNGP